MTAPYEIKLYRFTPEWQKASEVNRIDSLFTEIESRYWAWREQKHMESIKTLSTLAIEKDGVRQPFMTEKEALDYIDAQRESEERSLISLFETLNEHYIRLYPHVQSFNNVRGRKAIAEDKREFKEFCSGLSKAAKIVFDINPKRLSSITIWYGVKHKSTLCGINDYILMDIDERLRNDCCDIYPRTFIKPDEKGFETLREIILEEVSKHIFETRYNPKSEMQPLTERCCDLYSDYMKHKEWIFKGDALSFHLLAGEKIVRLLGLRFDNNYNNKDTFINALHPIHELKEHSLSDLVNVEFREG